MKDIRRIWITLLAASLCMGTFAGCASDETAETTANANTDTAAAETEEPDPFADFDYGGQSFRTYTSIHAATSSLASSN